MKGKQQKFQKYANIHQQFKPQPPQPLKKLPNLKLPLAQSSPYLQLDKVIGMSSKNNNSIAVNPISGEIAYPSGCIICIYSPKENRQTKFLYSKTQRSYSCIAYSHNGKYLAAGEGAFRQPEISIWEISLDGQYTEIKTLKGHKYGIESVMFSPNLNYLISLGDINDRGLFVWDWRQEQRVTSNKLGKPVNTFAFSDTGEFFVTAGYQHLKYWYFDSNGHVQKTETKNQESIMESKSADLAKVKLKIFVGVSCRHNSVFALAQDGHLYVYDRNRKLTKWMNIKVEKAISSTMTSDYLFCGCSDGVVRVFGTKSLEHIITLPKPPPLGSANIESGVKKIRIPATKDSKFADIIAIVVDEINLRVVVLYSDKMVFIWDIRNLEKISVYRTSLQHSAPIYDLQYIPNNMPVGFQDEDSLSLENENGITKFATCSSDRTIRFWHFIDPTISQTQQQQLNKGLIKNAYCKDMSRMIYVKFESRDPTATPYDHFKVKPQSLNEDGTPIAGETTINTEKDLEHQLRCIKISPDGKHIACGDWTGNIRIHDLRTFEETQCIQAHDSEVVCLEYSPQIDLQGQNTSGFSGGNQGSNQACKYWLASGSRDRLTQIYELSSNDKYENITILEDHSSTITSLKFTEEKSTKGQKRLKLLSSGADKQIILRNIDLSLVQQNDFRKLQNMQVEEFIVVQKKEQCKYKTFSMDLASNHGYAISGHDKYLQLWQINNCDKVWEKKPEIQKKSAPQDQIKVFFEHQTAGIVISSCTDKYVTIYEASSGNVICRTTCGEITTALCLSSNFKHLITTSAEGIIYIWRLPEQLTKALLKLKQEQKQKEEEILSGKEDEIDHIEDEEDSQLHKVEKQKSDEQNAQDEFNDLIEPQPQAKQQQPVPDLQDPIRISQIMKQINSVTGQINKLQPRNQAANIKADTIEEDNEEEFDFGQTPKDNEQQAFDQKEQLESQKALGEQKRNRWAKPSDSQNKQELQEMSSPEDMSLRPLKVKENKLPRWAQSVTGDLTEEQQRNTLASKLKLEEEKKSQINDIKNQIQNQIQFQLDDDLKEQQEDIEEIFSNTLDKAAQEEERKKQEIKVQEEQQLQKQLSDNKLEEGKEQLHSDQMKGIFYDKIEEDADEDKKSNIEEDDDEIEINQQIKKRQQQQKHILGLDEDEEEEEFATEEQKIRERLARRRQNEARQSQSQLFFQRKLGQSSEKSLLKESLLRETSSVLQLADLKNVESIKVQDIVGNEENDMNKKVGQQQVKVEHNVIAHKNDKNNDIENHKSDTSNHNSNNSNNPIAKNTDNKKPAFTILNKKKIEHIDLEKEEKKDLEKKVASKFDNKIKELEDVYMYQSRIFDERHKSEKEKFEQQMKEKQIELQTKKQQKLQEIGKKQSTVLLDEVEKEIKVESNFKFLKPGDALKGKGGQPQSRGSSRGRNQSPNTSMRRYQNADDDDELAESCMVQMESANKNNNQVDEAAINSVLKAELDKINNSLAKITQCLNTVRRDTENIRVKDDVGETMNRSMGLWNSMMMSLSHRTSFNVNFNQSQNSSFMAGGQINQSNASFFSQGNLKINDQLFILVSVKDDARDLLQKYSDLLVEEIAKKLQNKK